MTTDTHLSTILQSIIADDKRYTSLQDLGVYDATIEGARNGIRASKEEEMFRTPAAGVRGIAAKLRALWPDLSTTDRRTYLHNDAPDGEEEIVMHRLWAVMQEADKLAEEEERRAGA